MSAPFPGVLGHQYAREGLWRSIAEGRLHHAILIHGLQGVGKRTLAESVARTLLCDTPRNGPCDVCSHCRRTATDIHPDMVVLDREEVRGIDPTLSAHHAECVQSGKAVLTKTILPKKYMQKLGEWLGELPFEAKRRVAVVVDAERMNLEGANAFLKSLEEPAPGALALLTSSSPAFLRPTIRSRCASIRLSGVPQALIEERLTGSGVPAAEARFRAQASGGSLMRALQALPVQNDLRDQLLKTVGGGNVGEVAAFVAASMAGSKEADRGATLHLFATLLRDIAVLQSGGSKDSLVHAEVSDTLARVAKGPVDAFALFSRVVEARERVAGNANRVLLWDDLLHDASSGAL